MRLLIRSGAIANNVRHTQLEISRHKLPTLAWYSPMSELSCQEFITIQGVQRAPTIVTLVCTSLQQWGCTLKHTGRCADHRIKGHPRDPHAAVDTGLLLRIHSKALTEESSLFCKSIRPTLKAPTTFTTMFLMNFGDTSETDNFIMCAVRETPILRGIRVRAKTIGLLSEPRSEK